MESLGHEGEEAAPVDVNEPRGSMLSEISQRQRRMDRICLNNKSKNSHTENRLVAADGGTGREGRQKAQMFSCKTVLGTRCACILATTADNTVLHI